MIRWLIMPRGINVGKYNRVPMPELKQSLLAAGFADVVTLGKVATSSQPNRALKKNSPHRYMSLYWQNLV